MKLELKTDISKGRALKLLQKDMSRKINKAYIDISLKDYEKERVVFEAQDEVIALIKNEWGIKVAWWHVGHLFRNLSWLNEQTDIFKYGKIAKKHDSCLDLDLVLEMINWFKKGFSGQFILERYGYCIKSDFLISGLKDGNWDVRKLKFIKNNKTEQNSEKIS